MDFICEQGHIFELLVCLNVRRFGIPVLFAFHSELVSECKAWHDKEILAALIALAVVLPLPPVTVKKNLNPLRDPTGTQTRSVGKVTSISNAVTARAPWPPLKKTAAILKALKNWDSPCIGTVPYAHTTGKSMAGRLPVFCPALEPVKTAWQVPSIRLVAQKRGEQQVIQRTKKLYPRIQRYTICLAPTYRAAPSQNPGRFFCASYTGRSSD